jgi:hypothetical protein
MVFTTWDFLPDTGILSTPWYRIVRFVGTFDAKAAGEFTNGTGNAL